MGLFIRTRAGGHFVNLGKGNLEREMAWILFAFFGSTNKRLCRRASPNLDFFAFLVNF